MSAIIAAICSVARGCTVGSRQPSALASAWKIALVSSVNSPDRNAPLGGACIDLIVHVGDVTDIGDVLGAIDLAQQAKQHVEDDERPRIADMRVVIDRRPADIDAHIRRVDRHELLFAARQRIVKLQSHSFPLQPRLAWDVGSELLDEDETAPASAKAS